MPVNGKQMIVGDVCNDATVAMKSPGQSPRTCSRNRVFVCKSINSTMQFNTFFYLSGESTCQAAFHVISKKSANKQLRVTASKSEVGEMIHTSGW